MLPGVLQSTLCFLMLPRSLLYYVAAYEAIPRWGQAVAIVNDALFVYAGKTDESNSYSYTSAPDTNDVLYLSLSSPFLANSPPWELVSSSANTSTSQGPSLSWGTISGLNSSSILLFGGQPGPNSPIVNVGAADSAAILNVTSPLNPIWSSEPISWAGQPIRRLRHSAVTSHSGLVFMIGGEKADGSNIAFPDHIVFNPAVPSFTLLPTNGPPDVYGHASVLLPDGRILVFGGFSQSQGSLLPLSTIWSIDTTQSALSWSTISTATTSLPSPRMAFAAVSVPSGKVLIQGGCDASLETNMADGWILDTTQNPMTWTQVAALAQVGAKRDHFAVSSGDLVLFGFGYGNDRPAPALVQIFNSSSGVFLSKFSIPTPTSSPSQASRTYSPAQTSTTGFPMPPSGTTNGANNNNGNGHAAIAVGTTCGIISILVIGFGFAYYVLHRNRENQEDRRFTALGSSDEGRDSPQFGLHSPTAGMHEMGEPHGRRGLLRSFVGTLGAVGAVTRMKTVQGPQPNQRRDMLADEDTRSLGEWYNARRWDGTDGSSWSLRNILGGSSRLRSREASVNSHSPIPWREKTDQLLDGSATALMKDEETGFIGTAGVDGSRTHARRELSHASTRSGYRDPFVDPIHEERRELFDASTLYADELEEYDPTRLSVRHVPSIPPIRTLLPLSQQIGQPLSPLSERTSRSTLQLPNSDSSISSRGLSSEQILSPFPGGSLSRATSLTSISQYPAPGSPTVKTTSLIGASDPTILHNNRPMRRSNSWWFRFAPSSLLDYRRASDASMTMYEIRDPRPAPRLVAIEEASLCSAPTPTKRSPQGSSSGSPGGREQGYRAQPRRQTSSNSTKLYGVSHSKSMTSVKTADSEAIERMAGNMDVVQRVKSESRWGSGSTSSAGALSVDTHAEVAESYSAHGGVADTQEDLMMFASPVEVTDRFPPHSSDNPLAAPTPTPLPSSPVPFRPTFAPATPKSPKVAKRIQSYERRMSQDQTIPTIPPPLNSKNREERITKRVNVDYGLVPRPSLYVANPDYQSSESQHSVDS